MEVIATGTKGGGGLLTDAFEPSSPDAMSAPIKNVGTSDTYGTIISCST